MSVVWKFSRVRRDYATLHECEIKDCRSFGGQQKCFQCLFLQLYKLHRISYLSDAEFFLSLQHGFFPEYISLLLGERSIDSCSANVATCSPAPLCGTVHVTLLYLFRSLNSL